jgi:hypothetical protein
MAGPASSANNESAAVSVTSVGLGLGNGSQCIHEPVLDLGRVDDLDNLSPFGEQTNFSHFANELQASDPLRWGPIWIKRVFC